MATVFIGQLAVALPAPFAEGDILDETGADVLNFVQRRRVTARLTAMLKKGNIDERQLHAKALELFAQPMTAGVTLDDEDDAMSDPVLAEAMEMARNLITQKLAKENLPPPKNLDEHAKQVVDALPALVEQARQRVETRYRIAAEMAGVK